MRLIIFVITLTLISSAWAENIFDRFEEGLSQVSPQDSMHDWEQDLSTEEWQIVLENCYDRTVKPEAKEDLIKLLKDHDQFDPNGSARQNDRELLYYCSHALSLASDVGIELSAIPLDPQDHKTLFRAGTIEECYSVPELGLTSGLREKIRLVIGAQREATGKEQNEKISVPELMMGYVGICGAVFSMDRDIPVQVNFSPK